MMNRTTHLILGFSLALLAAAPLKAQTDSTSPGPAGASPGLARAGENNASATVTTVLPNGFNASINAMVREVREAAGPDRKRKILGDFLNRMTRSLASVKILVSLQKPEIASVDAWSEKFQRDLSELKGEKDFTRVPDAELDRFAGYVQQDAEQAEFGSGGIYLSTGVLLVLIILLILFH